MMKKSTSEFISIRKYRYHCRQWGVPTAPKIFMLHGWMDVGASFQFMVDALKKDWYVIAPDLRGFGLTTGPTTDAYWFPDYLGDIDAIFQHYSPNESINLVGHSLGANIVGIYAGIRSERVANLVMLEGVGLPVTTPDQAPERYRKWLDELRDPPQMQTYVSVQEVAKRLQKTNPRLKAEKAQFLAQHWSRQNSDGRWEVLGDPAHKIINPILYRVDEVIACWEKITAPVLWVEAHDTEIWNWVGGKEQARPETDRRLAHISNLKKEMVKDAGHMLHHDQPEVLARLIENFL